MDNNQRSKRYLSLILALVMIIGVLPIDIFAARVQYVYDKHNVTRFKSFEQNSVFKKVSGQYSNRGAADPSILSNPVANPVNESAPGKTSSRSVDAEGKPPVDWDKGSGEGRDDGSSYWSLPAGVSIVNAHNGPDPLNTFGFSYLGKYLDDQGRIVLKFDVGHRPTANSSVWSKYVMRFPRELYQAVDPEASYVLWKQTEVYGINNFDRLYNTDVTDQQAFTYQFPFRNSGAQYQHREINVVLKKDVNWEKDFEGKSQVIQLRLYNGDNNNLKLFSTSAWGSDKVFTSFGYNTHTKTAVVGDLSKRPGDLMESTTISLAGVYNDVFHTADSTLQLDKENKKVRIIYNIAKINTNAPVGTPNSEYKHYGEDLALRQSLDPDFVRFLDLTDKDAKIGTFMLYHEDEKPSKDGPLTAKTIDIYARDLNGVKKTPQGQIAKDENGNPIYTRTDKSVFIQFGTKDFVDKENPDSTDPNYIFTKVTDGVNIYNPTNNGNGILGVFEYNIDPTLINATMIKNKEFSKNFMFDTRYLTSNNEGMRKYTGVVQKDIVYGPNTNNFYSIRTQNYTSLTTLVTLSNPKEDFVLNIGGPNGIWKSWKREGAAWFDEGYKDYAISTYGKQFYMKDHPIRIGGTIKAGTHITVYIPESKSKNVSIVYFDLVTGSQKGTSPTALKDQKSLTGGNSVTLTKETKKNGSDVFHDPMYIKNTVSTIGGSAIREQYTPIVDEIFTDSKDFTGIMRTEGGVLASLYKPEGTETKEHFGENWLDSESDKEGNIINYERTDGKLKEGEKPESISPDKIKEERTVKGKNEKDQVVDKTFKGFRFTIKKLYSGGDQFKDSDNETPVENFGLIKDQPVMFNTFKHTSLQSAPVYEQVQAKVKFMLYPDQGSYMEKIVPLNKEYSIEPEKLNAQGLEEVTRLKTTGKPNPTYKGNGFLTKTNNIRIDDKVKEAEIERQAFDYVNQGQSIETRPVKVKYPNLLDHNGYPYDINNPNKDIADAEKARFIERLFPDSRYDQALTQEKDGTRRGDDAVVIGWTTKKIETKDILDNEGKVKVTGLINGMNQFYDLKKGTKTNKDYYTIRSLDDWKKVDDPNNTQNYIFDEYSPVDKNREVYAVWGVPCLVLHPNTSDDLYSEEVVRIPISRSMMKYTDQAIDKLECHDLDVITKATERPGLDMSVEVPSNPDDYFKLTIELGSNADYRDVNKKTVYLSRTNTDWTWQDAKALAQNLVKANNPNCKFLKVTTDAQGINEIKNDYAINGDTTLYIHYSETDTSTNKCNPQSLSKTKETYKNQVVIISDIPKAPYLATDKEGFDSRLKEFKKDNNTFVGWRAVKDPYGTNKEVKAELDKFDAGLQNGRMSLFEKSKALNGTERYGYMVSKYSAYLPNGYKLWVSSEDRNLNSREDFFRKVEDIHLYAMYRPFFDVTVEPRYMGIDTTMAKKSEEIGKLKPEEIKPYDFGKYVPLKPERLEQKPVNIALITRTAVTPFTDPTVAQSATYNSINSILPKGQELIQKWDPNNSQNYPKWSLPGYDETGRRKSYVSVVIPEGTKKDPDKYEKVYNTFGTNFTEESWKELGITTFLKLSGVSQDPNAPKNIYFDENLPKNQSADKYGAALPKKQAFTIRKNATGDEVDILTAATCRISQLKEGKQEISGYRIVATISPEDIPSPEFDRIRDRDDKVTLAWPGPSYTKDDYKGINKLEVTITDGKSKTTIPLDSTGTKKKEVNGRVIYFERVAGTNTFTNKAIDSDRDGAITAKIEDGKLVLGIKNDILKDLGSVLGDKGITMKYIKDDGTNRIETTATQAVIPIKTSKEVSDIKQTYSEEKGKAKINFSVPESIVDQVRVGTKYFAEKWDPNNKKWIKVGERVLADSDYKNNTLQGRSYEIELSNVKDGDVVRIKSLESNPDAKEKDSSLKFYDPDDIRNGAVDGYSLPNYSTRNAHDATIANVDKAPALSARNEGREYVTIDLKAPEIKGEAKDETFRRTIDLRATFNELLKDIKDPTNTSVSTPRIKVEFGTMGKRGTKGNKVMYFNDKTQLLNEVGVVERTSEMEDLKGIWVSVMDEFGNKTNEKTDEGNLKYKQTYQLALSVLGARPNVDYLGIRSDKNHAKITLTFLRNGMEQGSQILNYNGEGKTGRARFERFNLVLNSQPYTLQAGDEIIVEGEAKEGDKTYTTNPFKLPIQ